MQIVNGSMGLAELHDLARNYFDDFVKAVVDVERELLAVDAELHSDLEALLLQDGSCQQDLWGINLYPDAAGDSFIEFDSMINVRPAQNNRTRGVDDPALCARIADIVARRVAR